VRHAFLLALVLAIRATPVVADTATVAPPGGVAPTPNGGLVISSQICAALAGPTRGVPSADYQPGVGVNGNAVAPADLPSAPPSPSVDNFPIEIDQHLASRFNLPVGGSAKAILGYVTLRGNQAYFNGQPLNTDQAAVLAEACREAKH
jgi:hypothetical protein